MRSTRSTRCWRLGAALVAPIFLLGIAPPTNAEAPIGFEDQVGAPAPDRSAGIPITDQYATSGITFDNAYAYTYPEDTQVVDGTIGIEGCLPAGCKEFISLTFKPRVADVSLTWAVRHPLDGNGILSLEAFDTDGNPVGSDVRDLQGDTIPLGGSIGVKTSSAPIASATIRVEGPTLQFLVFDDIQFDPMTVGTPDLAIGKFDPVVTTDAVTFAVPVVNGGDGASRQSTLIVRAVRNPAWARQEVPLPAVPPLNHQTVTVVMPIPTATRAGTQAFVINADPARTSGDLLTGNNSLRVTVTIPPTVERPSAVESEVAPSIEAPTQAPPAQPTPTLAPLSEAASSSEPTLPFLGGLLIGAVVAAGAVVTWTRRVGSTAVEAKGTLSPEGRLELELKASDADPPKTCNRDGGWYCKREALFVPKRRTITALGTAGIRGGARVGASWPDEVSDRVLSAARGADSPRAGAAAVDEVSGDLARAIGASAGGALTDLVVTVHITGPSVTGTFTPYRCTLNGTEGTYEPLRSWSKTVADEFDRTIARLDAFDGSDAGVDRLREALRVGIRALAADL